MDPMNNLAAKMGTWLSGRLTKIEYALVAILITLVGLKYAGLAVDQLLIISFVLLAALYFLAAYTPPPIPGVFGTVTIKVAYISAACCVMSLMFAVLEFTGVRDMAMIAFNSIVMATLLLLFFYLKGHTEALRPLLLRSLVFDALTGFNFYKHFAD
jgi:hypothetical protein